MPAHLAMEYQIELNKSKLIGVDSVVMVIRCVVQVHKLIYKSALN